MENTIFLYDHKTNRPIHLVEPRGPPAASCAHIVVGLTNDAIEIVDSTLDPAHLSCFPWWAFCPLTPPSLMAFLFWLEMLISNVIPTNGAKDRSIFLLSRSFS